MNNFLYLIIAAVLAVSFSCDKIAGTVSDTETGKAAMVYNEDLTPAAGAGVWFFEVNDTVSAFETKTDKNGHYIIPALAKGTYNIIARKDSAIAFQDSVFISSTSNTISPDTLGKSGSFTGVVGLQINDDPATVTVQVLGTDIYSEVDSAGWFSLKPLAKGEYTLRLVTTLPDYSPRFKSIKIGNGKNDTLRDTIFLKFTGIPVVTGLRATYDTLHGVVHLSWNRASYRDLQDYLIYRDDFEVINLSDLPIAARGDTVFTDTVFNRKLPSGAFSFSDTNDYHFKYRVAVRSNVNSVGNTYKYIGITAASPVDVKTTFSFATYHIVKGFKTDSASVNDSLLYAVKFNNPTRYLKKITWTDLSKGTVIYSHALDSTKRSGSDTLKYSWNKTGEKKIECKVRDNGGFDWRDTCTIMVVKDAPVINILSSRDTVCIRDTIKLKFSGYDEFGRIVKWELSSGKSTFKIFSGADTFIVAPALPDEQFPYIVRGTDDDGNCSYDTLVIKVGLFRLATQNTSFAKRSDHSTIVFDNKMWVIGGGVTRGYNNAYNDVWYSGDGINWTLGTKNAEFSPRIGHSSVVFDNKMWVIGGSVDAHLFNDVWCSSDGKSWKQAALHAEFTPRDWHSAIVYDNKLWVIGGCDSSGFKNDIWYSTDGISWLLATANAPFSPRHTSLVVYDNKMWVIGGCTGNNELIHNYSNDMWHSTDGVNWIQTVANKNYDIGVAVAFNNKIWGVGATGYSYGKNDIWFSSNESDWKQLSTNDNFLPRYGHTCTSFLGKIWVIGGFTNQIKSGGSDRGWLNDVWYYQPNP